jgi:hypothetical protein
VSEGEWRNAPVKAILAVLIGLGASDCVRAPDADPIASGPSIDRIVRRIKCDLVEAVGPLLANPKYTWLQTWTAQASLTLIVNDGSTITPGATFTHPLPMVTIPGRVMNMGQSFNLGVGAGFNTTASHNETVTFSMSLQEIKDEHRSDSGSEFCDYPNFVDLHSELGLRTWIDDALSPAGNNPEGFRYLTPGHHKTSKATGGPSGGSSSSSSASPAAAQQAMVAQFAPASIRELISAQQKSVETFTSGATVDKYISKFITKGGKTKEERTDRVRAAAEQIGRIRDLQNRFFLPSLDKITLREIDDPATSVTTSVSNIAPNQGSSLGGTYVMITGANFSHWSNITIGGAKATFLKNPSDSTICAITPPHAASATPVDVVVYTNSLEGAGTKFGAFTYKDDMIKIMPHSGSAEGGETVTIEGLDFTGAESVTFGGVPGTNFTRSTDTRPHKITAKTPKHSPGSVDVVVPMPPPPTPPAPSPAAAVGVSNNKTGLFLYYNPPVPPSNPPVPPDDYCPAQASTKKKIIAYVDDDLNRKIERALFISRKLVRLAEDALKGIPEPQGEFPCDGKQTDPDPYCAINAVLQTTKALQDALLALQLDPPIDAIGHQSQFIIVYNANVSPSWTLVNFKGPSPGSGTGASATKTLTHTLNIAMGPPSSPDVANTLGALQIGTTIGNSLGVSGIVPVPP